MRNKPTHILLYAAFALLACACKTMNISRYYRYHQSVLDSIELVYKQSYKNKPFSIEFTDRAFDRVSLELTTDTLTYIYEFWVGEDRMKDTLRKYGFDIQVVNNLITNMRSVDCTWINNLDYYTDERKHSLVYVTLWPRAFNFPFVNKKYYILTYFPQPQYFDSDGNLLMGRKLRRIRKINAEVFRRINDKVCYTLSARFR
ncbi:hypothetical protein Q4E93_30555 [Flavitalea sp. BT771]|uniref:hypothetical protein n=1 Tax=Flavitalea sp. BT771 TaxID=3063329 RepID=UPI0026E21541|nr:hypothetical protein [Flavitalea sp. BT771]MDO6434995.1 hypothetical protein [Flavitalea sp. BT771]MDV6223895.1 hypothetical protein [Flavitalea sp. BT771]